MHLITSRRYLKVDPPLNYQKFIHKSSETRNSTPIGTNGQSAHYQEDLLLKIKNEPFSQNPNIKGSPLCRTDTWELWVDGTGIYGFYSLEEIPPVQICIYPDFSRGEIAGDFLSAKSSGFFPLKSLGMKVYTNWLGSLGDVILHASGVVDKGRGYLFAGDSGTGKSTLVAALQKDPSRVILGEDQVILRYLEGHFWIFGTPWHVNPEMCSPMGAPLEKIFFLERDGQKVKKLSALEGVTRILQTGFIPYYQTKMVAGILDHLSLLSEQTPFFTLSFLLDSDVWPLIRDA